MNQNIIFILLLFTHINIIFALYGQYIQVTDIHYDRNYIVGSDPLQYCHRGVGDAGYYSTQGWDCDTGYNLINATFAWWENWLQNNSNTIDFVLWTGDNAEHNSDPYMQRTEDDIFYENQIISNYMNSTFFQKGIPVIPAIGNNDFNPHDQFPPQPNNKWLVGLNNIWSGYLTADQQKTFLYGGYYYTQIKPDLYVIVLNTNILTNSNQLILPCNTTESVGYIQLAWMNSTLQMIQQQNAKVTIQIYQVMTKVIISGHMPPIASVFYEQCMNYYYYSAAEYQDIILAHQFGHFHADGFVLINYQNTAKEEQRFLGKKNAQCATAAINMVPSVEASYNPTTRLVKYNPIYPYAISQYIQYFSNVTVANEQQNFYYEVEYIFPQVYNFTTYDVTTYCKIYEQVQQTKSNPVQSLYDKYLYVSDPSPS